MTGKTKATETKGTNYPGVMSKLGEMQELASMALDKANRACNTLGIIQKASESETARDAVDHIGSRLSILKEIINDIDTSMSQILNELEG